MSYKDDEPKEMENDLEERLVSLRNQIELALLAFNTGRHELLPTALEDLYYKAHLILEEYCICDKEVK